MRIKVRYGFEKNEQIKQEDFGNIHTGFSKIYVVPKILNKKTNINLFAVVAER